MVRRYVHSFVVSVLLLLLVPVMAVSAGKADVGLKGEDRRVFTLASTCRDEVVGRFELMLKSGKLSVGQLFDTFYIPVPNTYPQKFHTQYDRLFDDSLQGLLDGFLRKQGNLKYFVITDGNGYLPTHNSRYSQPLTGNKESDAKSNRTKTIYSDRTGLAAARNRSEYLLQEYPRDTGEAVYDLSVPITVRGQHWGCVRVGYTKN